MVILRYLLFLDSFCVVVGSGCGAQIPVPGL